MAEIFGHPWVNGETMSHQEVLAEMTKRNEMVKSGLEQQAYEQQMEREQRRRQVNAVRNAPDAKGYPTEILEEAQPRKKQLY